MNYFDLYLLVLKTILESKATSLDDVRFALPQDTNIDSDELTAIIEDLIDAHFIRAKVLPTKSGDIFLIKNVTIDGRNFIKGSERPEFKEKLVSYLKNEGLPLNLSSASKFIAQMFL